jgi:hypothetical protein
MEEMSLTDVVKRQSTRSGKTRETRRKRVGVGVGVGVQRSQSSQRYVSS